MKHIVGTFALAALLAAPSLASAQQGSPVSFGVSGGVSLPTGNLGKFTSSGYDITGHVWLKPASFKSLGFRGDVSYDNWKYKNYNQNFRNLGVVANIIGHPDVANSSVVPYLIGGVGVYSTKAYTSNTASSSASKLGVQGGGGIEFKLSGFSTFVEAKLVNVFSDGTNTNWVPITFGVRF